MDQHLEEHECWICRKQIKKYRQHHHVMGVQNDPDLTVVLCRGCHWLLTQLARRVMLIDAHKMADLITLARFRAGLQDARTVVEYQLTVVKYSINSRR